jgi:hypothetical protein
MKKRIAVVLLGLTLLLTGCNEAARSFGGTMTLKLEKNQKLEMITWKEDSLWYLVRPMRDGESAETYEFKEDTTTGLLEGTVIIVEQK